MCLQSGTAQKKEEITAPSDYSNWIFNNVQLLVLDKRDKTCSNGGGALSLKKNHLGLFSINGFLKTTQSPWLTRIRFT